MQENNKAMLFTLNVSYETRASTEIALVEYCNRAITIDFVSEDDYVASFNDVKQMFIIVGVTLSLILGLIGILNFMNSVITSIVARSEFVLIQSIGMSSKQLTGMIVCGGLIYMSSSYLVVMTAGYLIGKMTLWGLGL